MDKWTARAVVLRPPSTWAAHLPTAPMMMSSTPRLYGIPKQQDTKDLNTRPDLQANERRRRVPGNIPK